MNKKISKLFFINAISFVSIPIIVSCSKSPNINDTNNVYNGFLEKQINITIDSTKPNYSLEDLKDSGFKFEVKPYQGNNELEKEYYEQLNKSLSKSSIKFLDFYIPKLNDDNNTYALFKINNNDEKIIEFPVQDFVFPNGQTFTNLTIESINSLIQEKIYSNYSFVSDLIQILKENIIKSYKEEKISDSNLTFEQYWKNNGINEEVKEIIKENILQKYPFSFSENIYPNLFISNIDHIEENDKILLSFKISTSEFNSNNENEIFCEIKNLTLWLN